MLEVGSAAAVEAGSDWPEHAISIAPITRGQETKDDQVNLICMDAL